MYGLPNLNTFCIFLMLVLCATQIYLAVTTPFKRFAVRYLRDIAATVLATVVVLALAVANTILSLFISKQNRNPLNKQS